MVVQDMTDKGHRCRMGQYGFSWEQAWKYCFSIPGCLEEDFLSLASWKYLYFKGYISQSKSSA